MIAFHRIFVRRILRAHKIVKNEKVFSIMFIIRFWVHILLLGTFASACTMYTVQSLLIVKQFYPGWYFCQIYLAHWFYDTSIKSIQNMVSQRNEPISWSENAEWLKNLCPTLTPYRHIPKLYTNLLKKEFSMPKIFNFEQRFIGETLARKNHAFYYRFS